jgi:hypothetical protein
MNENSLSGIVLSEADVEHIASAQNVIASVDGAVDRIFEMGIEELTELNMQLQSLPEAGSLSAREQLKRDYLRQNILLRSSQLTATTTQSSQGAPETYKFDDVAHYKKRMQRVESEGAREAVLDEYARFLFNTGVCESPAAAMDIARRNLDLTTVAQAEPDSEVGVEPTDGGLENQQSIREILAAHPVNETAIEVNVSSVLDKDLSVYNHSVLVDFMKLTPEQLVLVLNSDHQTLNEAYLNAWTKQHKLNYENLKDAYLMDLILEKGVRIPYALFNLFPDSKRLQAQRLVRDSEIDQFADQLQEIEQTGQIAAFYDQFSDSQLLVAVNRRLAPASLIEGILDRTDDKPAFVANNWNLIPAEKRLAHIGQIDIDILLQHPEDMQDLTAEQIRQCGFESRVVMQLYSEKCLGDDKIPDLFVSGDFDISSQEVQPSKFKGIVLQGISNPVFREKFIELIESLPIDKIDVLVRRDDRLTHEHGFIPYSVLKLIAKRPEVQARMSAVLSGSYTDAEFDLRLLLENQGLSNELQSDSALLQIYRNSALKDEDFFCELLEKSNLDMATKSLVVAQNIGPLLKTTNDPRIASVVIRNAADLLWNAVDLELRAGTSSTETVFERIAGLLGGNDQLAESLLNMPNEQNQRGRSYLLAALDVEGLSEQRLKVKEYQESHPIETLLVEADKLKGGSRTPTDVYERLVALPAESYKGFNIGDLPQEVLTMLSRGQIAGLDFNAFYGMDYLPLYGKLNSTGLISKINAERALDLISHCPSPDLLRGMIATELSFTEGDTPEQIDELMENKRFGHFHFQQILGDEGQGAKVLAGNLKHCELDQVKRSDPLCRVMAIEDVLAVPDEQRKNYAKAILENGNYTNELIAGLFRNNILTSDEIYVCSFDERKRVFRFMAEEADHDLLDEFYKTLSADRQNLLVQMNIVHDFPSGYEKNLATLNSVKECIINAEHPEDINPLFNLALGRLEDVKSYFQNSDNWVETFKSRIFNDPVAVYDLLYGHQDHGLYEIVMESPVVDGPILISQDTQRMKKLISLLSPDQFTELMSYQSPNMPQWRVADYIREGLIGAFFDDEELKDRLISQPDLYKPLFTIEVINAYRERIYVPENQRRAREVLNAFYGAETAQ